MSLSVVGKPSTLDNAVINLTQLRNDSKSSLVEAIEQINGSKSVLLDPSLSNLLRLIFVDGFQDLQRAGMEEILETTACEPMATRCDTVVYVLRPTFSNASLLTRQLRRLRESGSKKILHLLAVPQRSFVVEHILESNGILAEFKLLREYLLDFVPIDDDLLSLEFQPAFRELFMDGDTSCLLHVARGLRKLELHYGSIPRVFAKGDRSAMVVDLLQRLRYESASQTNVHSKHDMGTSAGETSQIDALIVLDRSLDLVSPLITPLTLEAQMDELFAIEQGAIQIDKHYIVPDPTKKSGKSRTQNKQSDDEFARPERLTGQKARLMLNSNDRLYAELRDVHVTEIGPRLEERAKEMQREQAARHGADISKLSSIVKNIPGMLSDKRSLEQMIVLAQEIRSHTSSDEFHERWQLERSIVEEESSKEIVHALNQRMLAQESPLSVLRLIALFSQCTEGGLKYKVVDSLRTSFIRNYGFQHIETWVNLENGGLIRVAGGAPSGVRRLHESAATGSTQIQARDSTSHGGDTSKGFAKPLAGLSELSATLRAISLSSSGSAGASWSALRKQCQLLHDIEDNHEPEDFSYVTSGYAPLSARLVQYVVKGKWGSIDALRQLPGAERRLNDPFSGIDTSIQQPTGDINTISMSDMTNARRKTILVCFVGGVTQVEVSALRWLAEHEPFDFIICTTHMTNGDKLVKSVCENLQDDGDPYTTQAERRAEAESERLKTDISTPHGAAVTQH